MANFLEELWGSIFTPGPTPTLLVATNASFAALQLLLFTLFIATYSIHFVILSFLCGGLWYSINWFARELQAENARTDPGGNEPQLGRKNDRSADPESDTETESGPPVRKPPPMATKDKESSTLLKPRWSEAEELRRRRSLGDSSGYVSTDSEWEKISESDDR